MVTTKTRNSNNGNVYDDYVDDDDSDDYDNGSGDDDHDCDDRGGDNNGGDDGIDDVSIAVDNYKNVDDVSDDSDTDKKIIVL